MIDIKSKQATLMELETILATPTVVESICNWNKARYTQTYDEDLQDALLVEELGELQAAWYENNFVEVADAYADIFYVAVGGLWKLGLTAEEVTALISHMEATNELIPPLGVLVGWNKLQASRPEVVAFIAIAACAELANFTSSDEAALEIIRAVCVSNDTKVVRRTASNIKANTAKGRAYVSPTVAITKILNKLDIR